jgi:hypothetical protein
LIIGFDANIDKLIQLYIVGVFTSFTLSQAGMVRHWNRRLATATAEQRRQMRTSRVINMVGAVSTAVVLIIVLYTKVVHGAWIAILAMVALFVLMRSIRTHYDAVSVELELLGTHRAVLPARNHAIVLVSRLHLPTMRAISYAKATRPSSLQGVTIAIDDAETKQLLAQWEDQQLDIPLVVLESPYREITRPVLAYIRELRDKRPRDVVTVFVPEYVVGRWWENLLHNQSALRLKSRLLFEPGVMVTSVPWRLQSTHPKQQPTLLSDGTPSAAPPPRSGASVP